MRSLFAAIVGVCLSLAPAVAQEEKKQSDSQQPAPASSRSEIPIGTAIVAAILTAAVLFAVGFPTKRN